MAADVHLLVPSEAAGERLDAYLGAQNACPSRSACAKLVEAGAVAVNGETCLSKKQVVCEGDRISIELPEVREPGAIVPQAIPLDIRYEDDHLLVLSKQRGLVCHPLMDMRTAPWPTHLSTIAGSSTLVRSRARIAPASCTGSTVTRPVSCSRLRMTRASAPCRI